MPNDALPSGVPTSGGEISQDEGMSLLGQFNFDGGDEPEDEAPEQDQPATQDDGGAEADEQSEPEEGEDGAQKSEEDDGPAEDDEEKTTEDDSEEPTLPPIDPPRSWNKEEKANFAKLPRSTQEFLSEREKSREADFLKRQNEAVTRGKDIESKLQTAEQVRQQHEAAVQRHIDAAAKYMNDKFSDIKTQDDLRKLAVEDPIRYNEYSLNWAEIQQAQAEQQHLATQRQQQNAEAFRNFVTTEQDKFKEAAPEYFDPKTAPKLQAEVRQMLVEDYGLSPQEIKSLWQDGAMLTVHDHRFQLLIRDANRFRQARLGAAQKKPTVAKPKTPVTKPGHASTKREVTGAQTKQLDDTLNRTGSRDAGLALITRMLG